MNDYTKDTKEENTIILLSVIAESVLMKRNLCRLLCVIKAGKLALCYVRDMGGPHIQDSNNKWSLYLL